LLKTISSTVVTSPELIDLTTEIKNKNDNVISRSEIKVLVE